MNKLPIRLKFALWAAGLAGALLLLYSIGTLAFVYREQIEAVDLELAGEAKHIAELDRQAPARQTADEIMQHEPWLAYALFDRTGAVQRRSAGLPESTARAALERVRPRTVKAAANTWRIGAFRQGDATIVVAYNLIEIRDIVTNLLTGYGLTLPLALAAAGIGGWWVAGRAIRPVRELTSAAERVQAAHLDQRVPVPKSRDDIQRLALVLNAMLARLEGSFNQANRFAADASHELRTPLTIIRGEIERMLHTPGLDAANETRLVSLQEEIDRLDHITDHLLLLARFDAGRADLRFAPVDLSALMRGACEDAELLATAEDVTLQAEIAPGVTVAGDSGHLRRLLLNLLQNATRHNRPGGEARCRLTAAEGRATISVSNTGPGIPPSLRERIFERFSRGDASRTDRKNHGLGLSLCREIAQAHGGTVVLGPERAGGWTEFIVDLPLARAGSHADPVSGGEIVSPV
jgi:signal transduction histidine kinase